MSEELLERVRAICLGLPESYEEPAWIGIRWCVRKRTFAHLVVVEAGSVGVFAPIADAGTDRTVVTFRAPAEEVDALSHVGHPFYFAGWGRNVIAMALEDDTDWNEVEELMTESYCVLAPAKLIARVDRP